jgi:hypothetical protein
MDTLLLDTVTWDLLLDANGNIAVATDPYSLAQDAASAIRTFLGECFFDTTVGVDYSRILGQSPPALALIKQLFGAAALTVPDVENVKVYISGFDPNTRILTGQVQVTDAETGQVSAATFTTVNPQGV